MLSLILTLLLAAPSGSLAGAGEPALSVPFLPQTEALCGGAAAAMMFRYWGDRHADVQQFAPLVDASAGGIANTALVAAIRARGWEVNRVDGSIASLREQVDAGRPVMLLIEDRPARYHYVVVVAANDEHIVLHDPAWGPSRRFSSATLLRAWKPSGYWGIVIAPSGRSRPAPVTTPPIGSSPAPLVTGRCDRLLDDALTTIAAGGFDVADAALTSVSRECPGFSGPLRELAGVRFAQKRWGEAASLAQAAVGLNGNDRYAWDVLGSSRFVQNDLTGALDAWNHVQRPQIDRVQIDGLRHTRYSLMAELLRLSPNTPLTTDDFLMARRRVEQLPDRAASRVAYRPDTDGFALVTVNIVERPRAPHGLAEWTAAGVQTIVDRQITAVVPGFSGQGEVWYGSWRWWDQRPRLALGFAAPRRGWLPGIWRVDFAREAQTYEVSQAGDVVREEQTEGRASVTSWLTPHLRYEASAGLDAWNGNAKTAFVGATVERRFLDDRASIMAQATAWLGVSHADGFQTGSVGAWARTSTNPHGFVIDVHGALDVASDAAPLATWSGAGDGRARPGLLRAHRLLTNGIVAGAVFGRQVAYANAEGVQWLQRPALVPVGIAAFLDVAGARDRLATSADEPWQADVGVGIRARLPGRDGTLRVDYGVGLRDGRNAVTVGWNVYQK